MYSRKFLSIYVALFIILSLTNCSKVANIDYQKFFSKDIRNNSNFEFIGYWHIPHEYAFQDIKEIKNKLYLLELKSKNIIIAKSNNDLLDFSSKIDIKHSDRFFPYSILKDPISMCSDENNTLYILETSDEVKPTGTGVFSFVTKDKQAPFNIKAIYDNKNIKEESFLNKRIKELDKAQKATRIGYLKNYLITTFTNSDSNNSNYMLFINKDIFVNNNLSYFLYSLEGKPLCFTTGSNSIVVLVEKENKFILYKYTFDLINKSLTLNNQIEIPELSTIKWLDRRILKPEILYIESEDVVAINLRNSSNIYIIKNNNINIIKSPKNDISNIFIFNINNKEKILAIEEGLISSTIYQLKY